MIKIQYSRGRGKHGKQYAFVRPSEKCANRSWRVSVEMIDKVVEKHFPEVNYYEVDGLTIGAKNPDFALKEYWRVCEKENIGKKFTVTPKQ